MRGILCGFALGVASLQQCAALPSRSVLLLYFLLALSLMLGVGSDAIRYRFLGRYARLGLIVLSVTAMGFCWAGWRAHERLAFYLPPDLEQRTLVVEGVIATIPSIDTRSARFVLALTPYAQRVRSITYAGSVLPAHFPRRIALNWYSKLGDVLPNTLSNTLDNISNLTPIKAFPKLRVGDRWRLKVRLTRIHGPANPYGTDIEAILLEQNIRAKGYVVHESTPVFLGHAGDLRREATQGRVSAGYQNVLSRIAQWRQALYERFNRVLGDAPHKGVMTALALGLQTDISAQDKQIFTRTGTNHLVAISGLHIALAAGFVGSLVSGIWRRLAYWGFKGPLWLAAPKIAALTGAGTSLLYAALSGMGVPAQRAAIMLCVLSVATLSAREIPATLKLAWALAVVLLIDPWAVVSAGFWLSFGAVAIILLAMRPGDVERNNHLQTGLLSPPRIVDTSTQRAAIDDASAWIMQAGYMAAVCRYWTAWRHRMVDRCKKGWATHSPAYHHAVIEMVRLQVAVTLGLLPLTALWFNQVSWVGPFANLIAIPWVSFAVVPLVLAGVVLPGPLDAWALYGAQWSFSGLSAILQWFSAAPWVFKPLPSPTWGSLVCAVIGLSLWIGHPEPLYRALHAAIQRAQCARRYARYVSGVLKVASLSLFTPLAFSFASRPALGEFRITALDVGQGSAVLIETAHHRLLFDAGPSYHPSWAEKAPRFASRSAVPVMKEPASDAGQRIILPYLYARGIDHLDGLVISHADTDHSGGAHSVLLALPVQWFRAALPKQHPLWAAAKVNQEHMPYSGRTALTMPSIALCQNKEHWVWDGVTFSFLWPDDPKLRGSRNAGSCVLRIHNARHAVLLAADIETPQERELVAHQSAALRADILVAPHHGSRTSSSFAFLRAVAAREVIFQMGYLNRFGHPHPTVVARYTRQGVLQHRSDWHGALTFDSAVGVLKRYRSERRRYWFNSPFGR